MISVLFLNTKDTKGFTKGAKDLVKANIIFSFGEITENNKTRLPLIFRVVIYYNQVLPDTEIIQMPK
jgi:hypothetical protein